MSITVHVIEPHNAVFSSRHSVDPKTISEAQIMQSQLREELQKIRSQINDPQRQEKLGWTNEMYRDWRNKAVHARNVKLIQQTKIQQWIQQQRASRALQAGLTEDPVLLLGSLLDLFDQVTSVAKVTLHQDQQDFLALVRKIANETEMVVQ